MSNKRIIIAGGGTGGHIFPAVAIANALQRLNPGVQLLFVGAKGKMEMEKVPQEGFEIRGLDIAGLNRSNMLKNILLPFKIFRAHLQAKAVLNEFQPDAVVGVGGYASFPVLNAAQGMGIPTLIQEQNSYAGKSNKILGKKAKAVCVAYEQMDKFFPKEKIMMTGNPVRAVIANAHISRQEAHATFNLDERKRTILVVGGSLGAKSINEAIDAHLDTLLKEDVQIIWQTGKPYYQQALARAANMTKNVRVFDFIRIMDHAYAAADVVISRAGALSIAELCIAARPVIFVPYPFAAEDHQTTNAMALVSHNAAMMIKNSDVKEELIGKLEKILNNESLQDLMTENLKKMAIKDADERIAKKILEIANV
jgi:UDP-N-acetylglucosamine--N-acetylmuramyl-(pentapeptide) pyrophosphoryl-undecaprenol N-acetylglucosamine transferase